jgi:CRP-like cAMP-binding protein
VAIARALLRNSPIMILDEATSALDAETESEILAELDEVTAGKTVISITHRLGLAIKSDTICVLQAGRIVQQGSHEELIAQPGLYRKLFEDQNRELLRRSAGEQLDTTLERVRAVPSFSVVPDDEVARLANVRQSIRLAAGQPVGEPNGSAERLFLLRSGQVELTVPDENGKPRQMQVGAPANGNGSLSLLLSLPRSVGARAVTESELHVLESDDLRGFLGAVWQQSARPGKNGGASNEPAPLVS